VVVWCSDHVLSLMGAADFHPSPIKTWLALAADRRTSDPQVPSQVPPPFTIQFWRKSHKHQAQQETIRRSFETSFKTFLLNPSVGCVFTPRLLVSALNPSPPSCRVSSPHGAQPRQPSDLNYLINDHPGCHVAWVEERGNRLGEEFHSIHQLSS
jgi:hypothetical protein